MAEPGPPDEVDPSAGAGGRLYALELARAGLTTGDLDEVVERLSLAPPEVQMCALMSLVAMTAMLLEERQSLGQGDALEFLALFEAISLGGSL